MFFKEEKRITMSSNDEDQVEETLNTEMFSMEEAKMRNARKKMEEVREENERLKRTLSQILKDYNSLKNQFKTQELEEEEANHESKKAANLASMAASDDDEESDLVSLSLGRFSNESTREDQKKKKKKKKKITTPYTESKTLENGGIELGLSCKPDSDNSLEASRSFDESKEEVRSSSSNKNSRNGDDEILQHNPLTKKPRVSVRAICNTQTMQDGCQWRKYGQKIAKGNPCPRAYYRCTVSSSCPVRKQVQRCMDDISVLITTYEGSHSHPLPHSAAAMASATSAATAMLSCGSSATSSSSSSLNNLLGYNFNSQNYPRATISSSQSHPTVVLDLTAPNHGSKFSSSLFAAAHSSPKSFSFASSSDRGGDSLQIGWEPRFSSMNSANAALFSGVQAQAANDRKIAAATAAITHDANFRSALAAAITSFVGSNNNGNVGGRNSGMDFHLNFSQPKSRDEGGQIKL